MIYLHYLIAIFNVNTDIKHLYGGQLKQIIIIILFFNLAKILTWIWLGPQTEYESYKFKYIDFFFHVYEYHKSYYMCMNIIKKDIWNMFKATKIDLARTPKCNIWNIFICIWNI